MSRQIPRLYEQFLCHPLLLGLKYSLTATGARHRNVILGEFFTGICT